MKLIGAGFGRTGTASLKAALEHLGYGPCFHMLDLIRTPTTVPAWRAAGRGERVDWGQVLSGWQSAVDWPACTFWDQLHETWPDAPVVLSVRDPEAWYRSCMNSIHDAKVHADQMAVPQGINRPDDELLTMIDELIWEGTFGGHFADEDRAVRAFERHVARVERGIPPGQLLVWNVKQGWEPLCAFLGVAVPEIPFPHLNDTATFRQMFGLPPLPHQVEARPATAGT